MGQLYELKLVFTLLSKILVHVPLTSSSIFKVPRPVAVLLASKYR
jgi:hypothetical protein